MKKILLVEDEAIVAKDLSNILRTAGHKICGVAHNYIAAMNLFKKMIPDLIICDINLGSEKSGVDFIKESKKIINVPVIYLSAYADEETVSGALETMPESYLTKPFNSNQLHISVNRVLWNTRIQNGHQESIDYHLPTKRELDIIYLITNGNSSKEIAGKLCISFETVQSHRKNIYQKFNINSSAELIALAHKNKWLPLN